jgi:transposase InsO family protein
VAGAERGAKARLARELGVSRSSLYYRPKRPAWDEALRQEIVALMAENPGYGSPRVALALRINRKRASRVMRKFGLKPSRRAKTPRKPGDQGRAPLSVPNILKQLSPIVPNCIWVSDFTYVRFRSTFVYLCTVLDLFTGEVLGSNIGLRHAAAFVWISIRRAVQAAGGFPAWFHSDQGSEYAAEQVQAWLIAHGTQISMSPKQSPWWNGSQESFFGRFKVEFGDVDRFETLADLVEALYRQLSYHSNVRIKSALRMSPAQFRKEWDRRYAALAPPPRGSPPQARLGIDGRASGLPCGPLALPLSSHPDCITTV